MKNLTEEQIIKALEYCSTNVRENTCPKCTFYKKHRCSTLMLNAVSDLINRKNAKIEELKTEIERLKGELQQSLLSTLVIDSVIKEMTEEKSDV